MDILNVNVEDKLVTMFMVFPMRSLIYYSKKNICRQLNCLHV